MKRVTHFVFVSLLILVFALTGCSTEKTDTNVEEETWQVSPAFTIPKPGPEGKDVASGLRGIDGKLAIVDGPVIAGENNKQLFHFWGGTQKKRYNYLIKR